MYKKSSNPITLEKEPLKLLTNQIINDLERNIELDLPYTSTYHLDIVSSLNSNPKNVTIKIRVVDDNGLSQFSNDATYNKNTDTIELFLDYNYYLKANEAIYFNELLIVLYHECVHAIQINNSDLPEWLGGIPYYNKIDEYEAYLAEINLNMEENYPAIARIALKAKNNKDNSNAFIMNILSNLITKEHLKNLMNKVDKDTYNKFVNKMIKKRYKELKVIYMDHYSRNGFDVNKKEVKDKILSGIQKEVSKDFSDAKFIARKNAYNKFLSFIYKKINNNSDVIFNEIRKICLSTPGKLSDEILSYKGKYPNIFDWLRV